MIITTPIYLYEDGEHNFVAMTGIFSDELEAKLLAGQTFILSAIEIKGDGDGRREIEALGLSPVPAKSEEKKICGARKPSGWGSSNGCTFLADHTPGRHSWSVDI